MLSRVTAKKVGDVFLRHTVYSNRVRFVQKAVGGSFPSPSLTFPLPFAPFSPFLPCLFPSILPPSPSLPFRPFLSPSFPSYFPPFP